MGAMWTIEYTDEFEIWWESLTPGEQVALDAAVRILEELGPGLARPHVDTVNGSRHPNMKELRAQCKGRPLRTLFAFDPRRCAILLTGGIKGGSKRFYENLIRTADRLYDRHLEELRTEGLL
ncbi:MAG: type II toxin-antitoxin system RelE/ParE family toxin [Lentisphaeria bacterium]|nr:type II toxin-antitoxin system RelE/ParE family toxin [Lentisphaeria bacterium]